MINFLSAVAVAIFALAPLKAFSLDGKLQLVNKFYDEGAVYKPMFGLNLHQKLTSEAGLNLWTGASEEPTDSGSDITWAVAKVNVDVYIKNLTIAPGIQYQWVEGKDFSKSKEQFFIKLEYKLF